MSLIEEHWKDEVIYYIEFISARDLKVSKAIVLSIEYTIEDVEKIILEKFNNVKKITHIDIWEECLTLRHELET